jgi:hypothetical protein
VGQTDPLPANGFFGTRLLRALRGSVRGRLALLLVLLVSLNAIFALALTLAELPGPEAISAKLEQAAGLGQLSANDYPVTPTGHQVDAFIDCVALGMGTVPGGSSFRRAIEARHRGSCPQLAASLREEAKAGPGTVANDQATVAPESPYFRIWQGYQVISRPVLRVVGVRGVRIVSSALLLGALLLFGYAAATRFGLASAIGLLAPLVLLTDFLELPSSFPHAVSVAGALCSGAVMCVAASRFQGDVWWLAASGLICGALFNFFDFVIHPPMAAALVTFIPVAWTASTTTGGGWRLVGIKRAVAAGAGWLVGYLGTWISKWLLAAAFFGFSRVFEDVKGEFLFRGSFTKGAEHPAVGATTLRNLRTLAATGGHRELWFVVLAAMTLLGCVVYRGGAKAFLDALVLSAWALLPPAYFEFARDQNYRHAWFMYRSLAVSWGIVLAALVIAARRSGPRGSPALSG